MHAWQHQLDFQPKTPFDVVLGCLELAYLPVGVSGWKQVFEEMTAKLAFFNHN